MYPTKIGDTDMKTDERLLHQCHPLICTKKQTENFLWIKIKDNSSAGGYCSSDNKYEWEASLSHILLPSQRKRTSYQILRFDALIPLFKTYSKLPK